MEAFIHLITGLGVLAILFVVYAESGLLIGFVFPGDSLLFTAGYMVQQNDPVFTRCRTLWRCCVIDNKTHEVISFVTDIGEFVDCQDAVEINELHKIEQIWFGR